MGQLQGRDTTGSFTVCKPSSGGTGALFHVSAVMCVILNLRYLASSGLRAPFPPDHVLSFVRSTYLFAIHILHLSIALQAHLGRILMSVLGPSEERITAEMESMLGDAKNLSNRISAENGKPDTIFVPREPSLMQHLSGVEEVMETSLAFTLESSTKLIDRIDGLD